MEDRDQTQYDDWKKKEATFHIEQDMVRSRLRIEQGRYKPVDYFLESILVYKKEKECPQDVQYMKHPMLIVRSLNNEELLSCLKEAELHASNEGK